MRRFVLRHTRAPRHTLALLTLLLAASVVGLHGWWDKGHFFTGQAAADALPADMPAFFREAASRLSYLNYEPDRWKESIERKADAALYGGSSPEHYVDLEYVPLGLLNLVNRYDFMTAIAKQKKMSGSEVGLLPYRMLELFQSTRINFRAWRAAGDATTRAWLEQRILDDAGILGHYVGDAANPLHTTKHHNGWKDKNPNKFTTDNTLHARFEGRFVDAKITIDDIRPRVRPDARIVAQPRREIIQFIMDSHAQVVPLYRLEAQERFSETTAAATHKTFVTDRLAAGATFLRDLWWTAYVTSTAPETPPVTPSR